MDRIWPVFIALPLPPGIQTLFFSAFADPTSGSLGPYEIPV